MVPIIQAMFLDHAMMRCWAGLRASAVLTLAILALGTALHLKHHLDDPHCDNTPTRDSHPCVSCSGLHGAAVTESGAVRAVPIPARPAEAHAAEAARPERILRSTTPSRAPPRA